MGLIRNAMKWFVGAGDSVESPAAKGAARRPQAGGLRHVNAKYDAAQLDDDNRRHWANADHLSARQANSKAVRERLVAHARYEVANNCYARGMVNTIADVTVGYGPTLKARTTAEWSAEQRAAAREVVRLFNNWAKEVDLWGKLWTMRVSKCQDGEAFGVFRTNPRLRSMVQLDLQLVEPEQITDGIQSTFDPKKVDGIDTDDLGNPVLYRVLKEHPDDTYNFGQEPIAIAASQVLHWFRRDRPGQLRGVPEITPALPLFAQLRRFTLATLTAAETAADFAAVIQGGEHDDDTQVEPMETIDIERGLYLTLPGGRTVGQLKAEHPTTTYREFKRELLAEIGRCLQMTKAAALLDGSEYNYSSLRGDKQHTDRSTEIEQYQCEGQVLSKVWDAWLDEAERMPGYLPSELDGKELEAVWMWSQLGHVDRKKESDGATVELGNNTTTLAAECAANGEDWEEQLMQRAVELARLRELGLDRVVNAAGQQGANDGSGNGTDGSNGNDAGDAGDSGDGAESASGSTQEQAS
jgi:lambda family phage portal protein